MLRIKVAHKDDLAPGKGMLVEAQGKKIALFNIDGKFYAIDDLCRHAGASLSQGAVEGKVVKCPKHGALFDILTGKALTSPALEDVLCYKISVKDDDVYLEILEEGTIG